MRKNLGILKGSANFEYLTTAFAAQRRTKCIVRYSYLWDIAFFYILICRVYRSSDVQTGVITEKYFRIKMNDILYPLYKMILKAKKLSQHTIFVLMDFNDLSQNVVSYH